MESRGIGARRTSQLNQLQVKEARDLPTTDRMLLPSWEDLVLTGSNFIWKQKRPNHRLRPCLPTVVIFLLRYMIVAMLLECQEKKIRTWVKRVYCIFLCDIAENFPRFGWFRREWRRWSQTITTKDPEACRYHWAPLVGFKTEIGGGQGVQSHVKEKLKKSCGSDWLFEEGSTPLALTNMLLVRLIIGELENNERLVNVWRRTTPIR